MLHYDRVAAVGAEAGRCRGIGHHLRTAGLAHIGDGAFQRFVRYVLLIISPVKLLIGVDVSVFDGFEIKFTAAVLAVETSLFRAVQQRGTAVGTFKRYQFAHILLLFHSPAGQRVQ